MLSWAKIWRANVRREYAQQMIELDPHSPPRLRINAILQHIDDFYSIFDVVEGDGVYLEPERRCTLWNEQ
jgi:putative endopeptidase